MKKHIFILIAIAIAFCSCSKEALKETQYIEDSDYPGLPIYSDMGYNTFGAYFNDKTFTSTIYGSERPFYMVVDQEGLTLSLYGKYQSNPFTLTFNIPLDPDFEMEDYHDLLPLSGNTYTIDTTLTTCNVKMEGADAPMIVDIYSGHFSFDNIRQVILDKEDKEVIVAGKFQFRAILGNGSYFDVVGGRFDLGVDQTNFVNFRR